MKSKPTVYFQPSLTYSTSLIGLHVAMRALRNPKLAFCIGTLQLAKVCMYVQVRSQHRTAGFRNPLQRKKKKKRKRLPSSGWCSASIAVQAGKNLNRVHFCLSSHLPLQLLSCICNFTCMVKRGLVYHLSAENCLVYCSKGIEGEN